MGSQKPGTSGIQEFFYRDDEDVYCAGAGYIEGPHVRRRLVHNCLTPKTFKDGLTGGKEKNRYGKPTQGGFGGGGAFYEKYAFWKW